MDKKDLYCPISFLRNQGQEGKNQTPVHLVIILSDIKGQRLLETKIFETLFVNASDQNFKQQIVWLFTRNELVNFAKIQRRKSYDLVSVFSHGKGVYIGYEESKKISKESLIRGENSIARLIKKGGSLIFFSCIAHEVGTFFLSKKHEDLDILVRQINGHLSLINADFSSLIEKKNTKLDVNTESLDDVGFWLCISLYFALCMTFSYGFVHKPYLFNNILNQYLSLFVGVVIFPLILGKYISGGSGIIQIQNKTEVNNRQPKNIYDQINGPVILMFVLMIYSVRMVFNLLAYAENFTPTNKELFMRN